MNLKELNEWVELPIEKILAVTEKGAMIGQGWSPQCEKGPSTSEDEWGVLKTTAIQPGYFLENENKKLPHHLEPKIQHEVKKGDLLITCAGPRNRCGIACLVRKTRKRLIISGKMYRFRVNEEKAIPEYIEAFLLSQKAWKEIDKMKTGISDSGLNLTHSRFKKLVIPLPSVSTQQAIVSKIEELFSEIEKGIESLSTAKQQLKTYRQSVLKWAFEGKLTNGNVKEGELPEGWKWVTMNDVCTKIGDIDHKMPKQLPSGYPYVSTKDFTADLKISFDKAKYVSKEDYLNLSRKIKPERGDIIFPRYGTIGKNILIDFDKEFLVSYSCAVVKPNRNLVESKYLYHYSLSPKITDEIRKYVVETTQANIGIASIKSFVFPLPPIQEQNKVIQTLENRLSVADKMEESLNQSLQQAEALKQSI